MALGGGMQAIGSLQAGNAGYLQGMYNAAIQEQNAKLALEQKGAIKEQGSIDRRRLADEARGIKGEVRAAAGAASVDPDWGSYQDLQNDTDHAYRIDRRILLDNETRNLRGVDLEAYGYKTEAELARHGAKDARKAGMLGAFSSLLSTAGTVAGRWSPSRGGSVGGGSGSGGRGTGHGEVRR